MRDNGVSGLALNIEYINLPKHFMLRKLALVAKFPEQQSHSTCDLFRSLIVTKIDSCRLIGAYDPDHCHLAIVVEKRISKI